MTHANCKKMFRKTKKKETTTATIIVLKLRSSQYRISATFSGQIHNVKRFLFAIFYLYKFTFLFLLFCSVWTVCLLGTKFSLSLTLPEFEFKRKQNANCKFRSLITRLPSGNICKLCDYLVYSIRSPIKSS